MSDGIDALGNLVTAGLAASELDDLPSNRRRRARERAVREAQWWRRHPVEAADTAVGPHTCANCETHLHGDFCHVCGQSAHVHRSVGHLLEEFAHGLYHFDSKAWRTLPKLVLQPGKLTRDYTHGRRARYVAPLALFLLSIFLMFFVFGFAGPETFNPGPATINDTKAERVADARSAVTDAQSEVTDALSELTSDKADSDTSASALKADEAVLAKRRTELATAQAALAKAEAASDTPKTTFVAKPHQSWQEALADAARSGKLNVNTGYAPLDAQAKKALRDPEFALYKVQEKASKLSFLLVPLSLPVLWLMFCFRRDVKLYDHVVFSLYSLSFMSVLFLTIALLNLGSKMVPALSGIAATLVLAVPLHMFAQLKGGYALGVWGALWRTGVLLLTSAVTLSLYVAVIVVLGLAG